ncbi:SGNH/GDSL hydrolase family protein [Phenylobacterium sp. J367]|uniref:SGNH/GDSL hydrolase family protein n=1 Tax=Phenylobacterium sp. J367 TaxID=2898435 RepID=UPI00215099D3|nr:SGNH/GDSL hydrolase family protein [Phenylobacterium sp. J367]MCR5878628.1 SGNH/GDSL hydrolase family protein [Phenylobacterium sp. J367]
MGKPVRWLVGCALAAGLLAPAAAAAPPPKWVGAWAASQQVPETRNELPKDDLDDATLRQVVRVTQGGPQIRIRVTNVFGTEPLTVAAVQVARPVAPGSPAIDPATTRAVTFHGQAAVTVPAGADWTSDPVAFAVKPLERIAISLHLPKAPARQTSHPGSRTTSWTVKGDHTAAADLPGAKPVVHWYQLAGVDVPATAKAAAIVAFGDSITDGFGVGPDRDDRWPDALAERLQADPRTRHLSVLNHGIGGNRVLKDELGPNALARFERDVLAQPGVRFVIILEGVNDLGTLTRDGPVGAEAHARLVHEITGAYAQMAARARARGIKVIGATILPFAGTPVYNPGPANEADRQAINAWIRRPGAFDAVIDFDALMRDPARPDRMRADLDSGDRLHPSLAGYRAMAAAIPLELFLP